MQDDLHYVVYRYHKKGECACKGKKIKRQFVNEPTYEDLINAI